MSGFILKRIRNLGIQIVRIRVVFRLFQINWNQHNTNQLDEAKKYNWDTTLCNYIYGIDIDIYEDNDIDIYEDNNVD